MFVFFLAVKNVISRKSSFVIMAFISATIMLLFFVNSIFDRSDVGIEQNYIDVLTGDVVIRPISEPAISLFGDESPMTGMFSDIPLISGYEKICRYVESTDQVKSKTEQLTVKAIADFKDGRLPLTIFGVKPTEYFDFFPGLKVSEGTSQLEHNSILVNNFCAKKHNIKTGDYIQVIVARGISSKVRRFHVVGIYDYPNRKTSYENMFLCEFSTALELMGHGEGEETVADLSQDQQSLLESYDIDSLFGSEIFFSESESLSEEEPVPESDSYNSNFLIYKLKDRGNTNSFIKKFNDRFKKDGKVEAINWRNSAGSGTIYISVLRIILNIGIYVILVVGFILVNNSLVINVLDRFKEIGTIRAIGASKRFICKQFMMENLLISLVAGIIGIILGILASRIINLLHVHISNDFVQELLSAEYFATAVTFSNFLYCFIVSCLVGVFSWILPLKNALSISPIEAMRE